MLTYRNGWIISVLATSLYLVAMWLYGDSDKRAPLVALVVCLLWVAYDVAFQQWPLLLPTILNIGIQGRNLYRMRRANDLSQVDQEAVEK